MGVGGDRWQWWEPPPTPHKEKGETKRAQQSGQTTDNILIPWA